MEPGDLIDARYRLVEPLGVGGMGAVWRAEQIALGRQVAVKVVAEHAAITDVEQRFRREAELAAKVEHRNVVGIVDFGTTEDGMQYLVMPLLRGESLEERLKREPKPSIVEVLEWVRGVLSGLSAIHGKGIVHRDLKPGNVFLAVDADGVVPKMLDFGISRPSQAAPEGAALTAAGAGIGTPEYMAPEQFESARDVTARADVWSVGAVLYAALAGRPPYQGPDAFAIYRAVLEREPEPLGALRSDLPTSLVMLVNRALQRDPSERFESARDMRDALDALLSSGELGDEGTRVVSGAARSGQAIARTVATGGAAAANIARTSAMPAEAKAVSSPNVVAAAAVFEEPKSSSRSVLFGAGGMLLVVGLGIGGYLVATSSETEVPPIMLGEDSDGGTPADATSVSMPVLVDAQSMPGAPGGFVVSRPGPLPVLARRWAEAPAGLRAAQLRFVSTGVAHTAVVAPSTEASTVAALGRHFGIAPVPGVFDPNAGLQPALLRSTVRLNVRAQPSTTGEVSRVMPHDGLVVGLYGMVEGTRSQGGDDAMTYFAVSADATGWASSRMLAAYTGCLPAQDELVDAMLESLGYVDDGSYDIEPMPGEPDAYERAEGAIARGTSARTHIYLDGRRRDAFMVAAVDDTDLRESMVAMYTLTSSCEPTCIGVHEISGLLDEHFLTESVRGGGESLLALSYADGERSSEGILRWEVHRLDPPRRIWEDEIPTAPNLSERRRGGVAGNRDRVARQGRGTGVIGIRLPGEQRNWLQWASGVLVERAPAVEAASEP